MDRPWIERADKQEAFKKGLQAYYHAKYSDSCDAIVQIIMEYRERFEAYNEVVRSETGRQDFDSVIMALIRCFYTRSINTSEYSIRGLITVDEDGGSKEFPLDHVHFDYGSTEFDTIKILHQRHNVNDIKLSEILHYGGERVLQRLRIIAKFGHDVTENVDVASSLDQLTTSKMNSVMFVNLYDGVRPTEHSASVMQQKLMGVLLKKGNRLPKVINFSVSYIDELAQIKAKGGRAVEIADFLLSRYMSTFLYQLPVLDKLDMKLSKDGRSVADALESYGVEYEVTPVRLFKFINERKLRVFEGKQGMLIQRWVDMLVKMGFGPEETKDEDQEIYDPHGKGIKDIVQGLAQHIARPETERNFAFYAAETLLECLQGKEPQANGNIKLSGKEAYLVRMMLDSKVTYDLSHFWVGKHSKATMMPPGRNICTEPARMNDLMAYRMLHEKCGGSNEQAVKVEVTTMAVNMFEVMTTSECYIRDRSRIMLLRMLDYMEHKADPATREFFKPRLDKLLDIIPQYRAAGQELENRMNAQEKKARDEGRG